MRNLQVVQYTTTTPRAEKNRHEVVTALESPAKFPRIAGNEAALAPAPKIAENTPTLASAGEHTAVLNVVHRSLLRLRGHLVSSTLVSSTLVSSALVSSALVPKHSHFLLRVVGPGHLLLSRVGPNRVRA